MQGAFRHYRRHLEVRKALLQLSLAVKARSPAPELLGELEAAGIPVGVSPSGVVWTAYRAEDIEPLAARCDALWRAADKKK